MKSVKPSGKGTIGLSSLASFHPWSILKDYIRWSQTTRQLQLLGLMFLPSL